MGIIWTTWWRGLLDDTKYQIPRLYAKWFLTRRFICVPYINLWKTCESGAGHFWAKGNNFNKISRGLLDDATYYNTRLYIDLRPFHIHTETEPKPNRNRTEKIKCLKPYESFHICAETETEPKPNAEPKTCLILILFFSVSVAEFQQTPQVILIKSAHTQTTCVV